MRTLNAAVVLLAVASFAAIAAPGKYETLAVDLMDHQQFTEWQHYASATPFFAMNGRRFSMTIDDFADVMSNTFKECEDMDAYTNRKGSTDDCKAYIYKGIKEWTALSRDKSVSDVAWKMGTQYAFNSRNPIAHMNVWDFNGWAAGIRVAKSKGY
ncbi:TPA: hypothetical protein MM109_000892 [Klebsiella pneumoniae]|uniref:hypothetical protein n=1 Tax=Klebsiella pneumoniae TaxID=573 RepID=UPI000E347FA6|nr:hypothetical protein [Klebsiella pneumoniae]HBT2358316.1 hypothetical protein [Klebsiella pneumoniae subsp. pneumoniae]EIV2275032.1 hypothetical protein [Klebsiella pneumoniae]EIW1121512.1 hypothetical protein [Klebsiella pneumoniae]EKQ7231152.1 hypothetical protein [Klebsiella pneumoniae]EKX1446708.1 hypothetical protein [Klebsiella pneumoniae]